MRAVDLVGIQMDPLSGIYALVLREHDEPNRLFPIVVGGAEAMSIALAAQGQAPARPMTHDLMAALVESFDGRLDAVEVTDLDDGAFLATLAVSGPTGERRLDTRPSDAIALAIRLHAPLFVSDRVLDEVGMLPDDEQQHDEPHDVSPVGEPVAPELIDAAVDEFRGFLADLDPADFADDPSGA